MSSDSCWPSYDNPANDPREDLIQDAEVWKFVVEHTKDPEKCWFWNGLRCMGYQFIRNKEGGWMLTHDTFPQPPSEEQVWFRQRFMLPEKEYIVKTLETLGRVYSA